MKFLPSLLSLLFCFFLYQFIIRKNLLYNQISRFWLILAMSLNIVVIECLRAYGSSGLLHKFVSFFYNWYPAQERWLDAQILFHSVSCSKQYNLFESNPCFSFLWNYPTFYKLVPPALDNFVVFISLALIPIGIFAIYFILVPRKITVFVLLFWISPPVLFLIERANFEGLVVLCLIIAERAFFIFQRSSNIKRLVFFGGFSLSLTFAISIKFYPIVIFLYFYFASKKTEERLLVFILLVVNIVLSVVVFDLASFIGNAPSPDGKALGLKVLFRNIFENPIEFFLLLALLSSYVYLTRKEWKMHNGLNLPLYKLDTFGLSLVFLFLCAWCVGGNTQYRLILLAPFILSLPFQDKLFKVLTTVFLGICYSTTWPLLSNLLCIVLFLSILKTFWITLRSELFRVTSRV